jgi:hypothetical protein
MATNVAAVGPVTVAGAVYSPDSDTVPTDAFHVTAVFVVPVTVAVNCCV